MRRYVSIWLQHLGWQIGSYSEEIEYTDLLAEVNQKLAIGSDFS